MKVLKKTRSFEEYSRSKITIAIIKAMESVQSVDTEKADEISRMIESTLTTTTSLDDTITVDHIHNLVENQLMTSGLNQVAKEYILYREKRRSDIFKKRLTLKPDEYPELAEYVDSIRHSYWIHDEFNYTSDIQDIKVTLSDKERTAVVRSMLAISQVEVAVKTFWGKIYDKMPKPEIGSVGATFAESEVRHADAYSNLIKLLGLYSQFESILEVPAIRKRVKYLEKAIANGSVLDNREYFESVILFSMFVENVSLFSQFLVIMSFNKHKNILKGMSNVVEATSKEEQIHANFGFDLVNTIKRENPDWWTDALIEDIVDATLEAYDAEEDIVEWIFELGDLDFLTKNQTLEFIKNRFNKSLNEIGIDSVFEVNSAILLKTEWFDDEVMITKHTDFFNKRSINYTKRQKSITEDDLF